MYVTLSTLTLVCDLTVGMRGSRPLWQSSLLRWHQWNMFHFSGVHKRLVYTPPANYPVLWPQICRQKVTRYLQTKHQFATRSLGQWLICHVLFWMRTQHGRNIGCQQETRSNTRRSRTVNRVAEVWQPMNEVSTSLIRSRYFPFSIKILSLFSFYASLGLSLLLFILTLISHILFGSDCCSSSYADVIPTNLTLSLSLSVCLFLSSLSSVVDCTINHILYVRF